jgi:hypothetical protein
VLFDEFFFRANSNAEADEKLLWRADAAVIRAAQSNIANASPQERDPAVSTTPISCDTLERLVELRLLHQTQRAANSVRSRGESKTQESQDGRPTETSAAAKRQKLCTDGRCYPKGRDRAGEMCTLEGSSWNHGSLRGIRAQGKLCKCGGRGERPSQGGK